MKQKITLTYFVILLLLSVKGISQSTETFETETIGATSFTDNGQLFNISSQSGGSFYIYYDSVQFGWNGTANDNFFIDNSSSTGGGAKTGINAGFTISSQGATAFTLKKFYAYLAYFNAVLTNSGTMTVTGTLGGVTQFTATLTSGTSNTSSSYQNGYTLIDLSTLGGSDNSNTAIDSFVITTTGNYEYIGLDAMTWGAATLSTGVFESKSKLTMYPNPSSEKVQFTSSLGGNFQVINQLGQTVKTFKSNINVEATVYVGDLSEGIYFVKATNSTNASSQKLVIKN